MLAKRNACLTAVAALALVAGAGSAQAQYQTYDEEGFFVFLDAVFTSPQDTEQVVAQTQSGTNGAPIGTPQVVERKAIDWGSGAAGRIEFGYRWSSGSQVSVNYWQFENDERLFGDGPADGFTNFAIGPFIYSYPSGYFGTFGAPGHFDFVGEISAETFGVEWGRKNALTDKFNMQWSVGVRYARFEESVAGFYDFDDSQSFYFGDYRYWAAKQNEGEMAGLSASARGELLVNDWLSFDAGVGFSFLNGDVTSTSAVMPIGPCNTGSVNCPFLGVNLPSTSFRAEDDRSGRITDFDLRAIVHLMDDRYRLWLGYEHSDWEGPPADLTRQVSGGFLPVDGRESVAFTGFKLGVGFRF